MRPTEETLASTVRVGVWILAGILGLGVSVAAAGPNGAKLRVGKAQSPPAAQQELAKRFDPASQAAQTLNAELRKLLDAGEIASRGELPVRWGRAAKPSEETHEFSIDVVHMTGAGPRHRHPAG